jgi:VWFA-related protein
VVADKAGNHVKGLKQEDFTLTENGIPQKIAFFEEVSTGSDRLHRTKPEENTFSNFLMGQPAPKRVTIIVLDLLNTGFTDQVYARNGLVKFLSESLDSSEPIALFLLTRDGLKVVHDFTTDPKVLVAAIRRVKGSTNQVAVPEDQQTEMSDAMAVNTEAAALQSMMKQAETVRNSEQQRLAILYTLQAMQQLARAFGGVPGRKSVVWASGSFPFDVSDTTMEMALPGQASLADVLPLYERTWQELNDANLVLYPVDVRGLIGPQIGSAALSTSRSNNPFSMANESFQRQDTINALRIFADQTGGKAFVNTNDIAGSFQKAAADSSHYYILAYYMDHSKEKPGWHKLDVKVAGDHIKVRARSGFLLTKTTDDPNSTRLLDLDTAMNSPIDYTEIPLRLRWAKITPGKDAGHRDVEYFVDMPAGSATVDADDNNHMRLEFIALIKTPEGKPVDKPEAQVMDAHVKPENLQKLRSSGFTYRNILNVTPGEYLVRFVVRDGITGKMGSVGATLNVAQ